MTREESIRRVHVTTFQRVPEDLTLQIHLRLCPDEEIDADRPQLIERDNTPAVDLYALAYGIYAARRKRDRMVSNELFGEPAWDMMLALYCLPARGENLCVTALSYAANVGTATGCRVQAALEAEGLIERKQEISDRRRSLVTLTETGRSLLEKYLTWLSASDNVSDCFVKLAAK